MRCSTKGASHCCFSKTVSNKYFQKFLLINFISTCSNWRNNFSFTHFTQLYSLHKRLWKSILYEKSRLFLLLWSGLKQWESLPREFYYYLEQFTQPFHFSLSLADKIDYQQGVLQKEPVTAPFIERFNIDESMKL